MSPAFNSRFFLATFLVFTPDSFVMDVSEPTVSGGGGGGQVEQQEAEGQPVKPKHGRG